jgi:UDP-3-O-[3-hydroxymyristoyl] glucosamine N-acyltransferase
MADRRFFTLAGPFTLQQLAEMTGSELSDPAHGSRSVHDVAPLHEADAHKVSFFDNRKYADYFRHTRASAVFAKPDAAPLAPAGTVVLKNKNPYKAYAIAAAAFYPMPHAEEWRAPTAIIDETAMIGPGCHIEHGVVIGKHVKIGARCRIQPNAVIRDGVEIGEDGYIGANVYITHAIIGKKAKIYPGAVIGRQGFGFAIDPTGYVSVPQLGRVIIEDDVEIGANTTVDRGAGPDTVIGQGCRIDNLVQIGHNVKLGKYCVIVSQTGISGSTQLGDYVMTGGQSGFAGHIKIGNGAKVAAQSGVLRDVSAGDEVMGTPAVPLRQFLRQSTMVSKMATAKRGNEEE